MIQSHRDAEIEIRRLQDELSKLTKFVKTTAVETRRNTSRGNRNLADFIGGDTIVGGSGEGDVIVDPGTPATVGSFPLGTINTLDIEYEEKGGVMYYRLHSSIDNEANSAGFAEYSWTVTLYSDAGGTTELVPPSTGIEFNVQFDITIVDAYSDWWPLADAGLYAQSEVKVRNSDNVLSTGILSLVVPLDPNPGLPGVTPPGPGTFPVGTTVTLTVVPEDRGGVTYYRLESVLSAAANVTNFTEYSWTCELYDDSGGSTVFIPEFQYRTVSDISVLEGFSDWWPLADTGKWVQTFVRVKNSDNELGTAIASSTIEEIDANPGIPGLTPPAVPDFGARTITAGITTEERGQITYFKITGTLSSAMGAETVEYLWFYQQFMPDHSTPEYDRIEFRHEYNTGILTAATDWWPLADAGRYARVYIIAVNRDGVPSTVGLISNEVTLAANPGIALGEDGSFPVGTTVTLNPIEYENRGGVVYYRLSSYISAAANASHFSEYSWRCVLYNNSSGTGTPYVEPFEFLAVPFIGTLTALTDWWPLADVGKYVQVAVRVRNEDNVVSVAIASAILALSPNPGIDPDDVITLGSGAAYDSTGKLVSTPDGLKNAHFDYKDDESLTDVAPKDWSRTHTGTNVWTIIEGTDPDAYLGRTVKYLDSAPTRGHSYMVQVVPMVAGRSYRAVFFVKTNMTDVYVDMVAWSRTAVPLANPLIPVSVSTFYKPYVVNITAPLGTNDTNSTAYGWVRILTGTGAGPADPTLRYIFVDHIDFFAIDTWDQSTLDQQNNEDAVRIKNFGVTQAQIKNLEVVFGKLGTGSVKDAVIATDGISDVSMYKDLTITDDTMFANLVIGKAKVGSVYAVNIFAGQISGCTLYLNNGSVETVVDLFTESAYGGVYGGIRVKNLTGNSQRTIITAGGVACINQSGTIALAQMYSNANLGGFISVRDAGGTDVCSMNGTSGLGAMTAIKYDVMYSGTLFARLEALTSTGALLTLLGNAGSTTTQVVLDARTGSVRATKYMDQNNVQVLGIQQTALADPVLSAPTANEIILRDKMIECFNRLRNHGIMHA